MILIEIGKILGTKKMGTAPHRSYPDHCRDWPNDCRTVIYLNFSARIIQSYGGLRRNVIGCGVTDIGDPLFHHWEEWMIFQLAAYLLELRLFQTQHFRVSAWICEQAGTVNSRPTNTK